MTPDQLIVRKNFFLQGALASGLCHVLCFSLFVISFPSKAAPQPSFLFLGSVLDSYDVTIQRQNPDFNASTVGFRGSLADVTPNKSSDFQGRQITSQKPLFSKSSHLKPKKTFKQPLNVVSPPLAPEASGITQPPVPARVPLGLDDDRY